MALQVIQKYKQENLSQNLFAAMTTMRGASVAQSTKPLRHHA